MSILVECKCGKSLRVKDDMAGKKGRCPACGEVLSVPVFVEPDEYDLREPQSPAVAKPASMPSQGARLASSADVSRTLFPKPLSIGPSPVCPSCNTSHPPGTKICVACGIDLKTGKPILVTQDIDENVLYGNVETAATFLSWILPIALFPIASEAYGKYKPYAIRIIAGLTALISIAFWIMDATSNDTASTNFMLWAGTVPNPAFAYYGIPQGEFHYYQLLTNVFLHAGIMHLAGNLVFMLVFGNRINALLGQWKTALLYFLLAIIASGVYCISEMGQVIHPALGASGAIMGLAGIYFVLMPASKVHMVFWARLGIFSGFRRYTKIFALRGFWVLLFYIAFDVAATAMGSHDGTAHWAHLGGFLGGMIIGSALLLSRMVYTGGADLLTFILGKNAWKILGTPSEHAVRN